jgi:predicted nucleotidyltransferase
MTNKGAPETLREAIAIARANAAKEMGLKTLPRERVVLFGSRAAGAGRPDSDWDLVLVDRRAAHAPSRKVQVRDRARGVDVVVVPSLDDETFLGSELGAHVAWYGLGVSEPLPDLRHRVRYQDALERGPVRRIRSKLRVLLSVHQRVRRGAANAWQTPMMQEHAARVILDVARAVHLKRHQGSPPSLRLAEEWTSLDVVARIHRFEEIVGDFHLLPDVRHAWERFFDLHAAAWLVLNDRIARAQPLPRSGGYS